MRMIVGTAWALGCVLAITGCAPASDPVIERDGGGEPVVINGAPTGSIKVPSLCERKSTDLRVTTGGADAFAVAWADNHYQVVYVDHLTHNLLVVQLDYKGTAMSPAAAIEARPAFASTPSLLATKDGYLVAWEERDPLSVEVVSAIRVHALDKTGTPVGLGQTVALGPSAQMRPVLASSPAGTAISWMVQSATDRETLTSVGDSGVNIGILDDALMLRTDVPVQHVNPGARSGYPWVAGDEAGLALLWTGEQAGPTDPYVARLDPSLALGASNDVRDAGAANAALLGRLLLTDFGYFAAWEDLRSGQEEIYMAQLKPSGERVTGGLVEEPNTGNANWPHIAWTGTTAAVVYYQFRAGKPQVFMTFVDGNGQRIGGAADAQVSNTTVWARFPDVVWTGTDFGVLWLDARDGDPELYFNRATCSAPVPI